MIIEDIVSSTIMQYLGSPLWVGLILILFFVAWAAFMKLRLEVALVGLVPAFILASAFIPGLGVMIAIVGGALLGYILIRLAVR